ncbi:Translation initiation factor 2 [Fimbriiglobus ruber]|uniref:Translation initiation factor 2 n=1 Tax=Fimbriiglobus ruber TaxID=1908690 RepID=A0A225E025_9BACT|nr:Translation initiation factor 2 [Fimbriiglobus ruber]
MPVATPAPAPAKPQPAPAPAAPQAPAPAPATLPAGAKIAVYPPDINLETARDRQSFVVQATFPDGITRDVSDLAQVAFANPALVKLDKNTVYPVADGTTEMTVTVAGQAVKIPVKVVQAKTDRAVSFKLDVAPVFLRTGCNTGGCHGAARGKDGFRLSLFGFDPDGDHYRLTRELNGRRINLASPPDSLLLEKAAGKVPHTGGQKMKEGDEYYNTIVRWLEADAPLDPPTIPTPVSMEVFPPSAVLDGKGEKQRLVVRAKYSDGTDRDVTNLALFLSNNDNAAKIDGEGAVTAGERGEAFVMARFYTFTIGVPFITLPKGFQFAWPNVPEYNYVDGLVNAKLKKLRIEPSGLCDDQTFLRRVYLDIIGVLPTPDEYARFLVSTLPNKREILVDELLDRKEFAELWVLKWAELLQIRSDGNNVSPKAMLLYYTWLQDKIARNVPTDEWVRELLGANGGTFKNPASNYYQIERDILKVTENVAQVFMGMRVQCAQCHNHPFDRWTMDDYYGFAAFFSQIGRKAGDDPRELIVFNSGGGEVNHPIGGRQMKPKFLGGDTPDVAGKDRREVLAGWLASPNNPYFAKNLANMVWAHFLGVGIIDQVDDVRISNPASNQELLDELGKKFTGYRYDFKKLVRDICTSATYQRATQPTKSNEGDSRNFARGPIRRIRAETMLDVVSEVTATKNKFPGLPQGARAVQIADGQVSTYFLTTFGRPTRETVCSCEVRLEPTLSQSLHLMNGDTVGPKIQQGNLIGKWLQEKKPPAYIIEQIFVRCLNRAPRPDEMQKLTAAVDANKDKVQALEDVFWAVLNSREFMFNH